jgi:hypothetical protein
LSELISMSSWTKNEDGPVCACGGETVVKIMPDGRAVLLCFFHTSAEGAYWSLPDERPDGFENMTLSELQDSV